MHAVVALALPTVEAFDLAIPSQVFGDQVIHADRYTFTVCAPSAGLVPSTAGYAICADRGLDALADADTVVVPGYLPLDDPGEAVCSALRAAAARGARVVSVCTGAFALAAAGLLDHRRATTHWQYADDLSARFPAVKIDPDVLWVDEGAVLTSAGLAAGIDLCVQLVRDDYGTDAAIRVARRMVVAPHRDGGQAQWLERPVPRPGRGLAATCEWALEHLADPLTVADLARHAGWAPRTFSRQFVAETGLTPLRWLTAARVREARRLLEVSDLPVEDIARRSGLGSPANLRVHLARDAGATPTAYRAAYQGRAPRSLKSSSFHVERTLVPPQRPAISRSAVEERLQGMSIKQPFEKVVEEHGRTVLRVCRALLAGPDADDAWSETFLSAMRAYPELPVTANLEAWLVTIAHRKAIDVLRSRQRQPVPVEELAEGLAEAPTGLGVPGADDGLWQAVRALPDRQRQAVAYHYVAGLPYAEIAQILGGTTDAARRAAADGIKNLRRNYPGGGPA